MKRSSRAIEAAASDEHAALIFENGNLKARLTECTKTITAQNKHIEGLRVNNAEFAKTAQLNNLAIKDLLDRSAVLSRENLIANANCTKLKLKIAGTNAWFTEFQKLLVCSTNHILKLNDILEEQTDSDLTLGNINTTNSIASCTTTTPKNNIEMKVLPTISGHTIQKPTISLTKSDLQQIDILLKHQTAVQNESNNVLSTNSVNNSISNVSDNSCENTLQNISTTDDINNQQNTVNGNHESNENESLSEKMENSERRRLSTLLEMTNESTINNINIVSNIGLSAPNTSGNSSNSSRSFTRSKKRLSNMPSPIEISSKILRNNIGNFSDHNITKKRIFNTGISTSVRSSLLNSENMPEDPLEGPSTLLNENNEMFSLKSVDTEEVQPLLTSTPTHKERIMRKRASVVVPSLTKFITTRKIRTKESNTTDKLNISKSLNDLSNVDDISENLEPTPPRRRTRNLKQNYMSLIDLSEQNNFMENENGSILPVKVDYNSIDASTLKKPLTSKSGGRPKKKTAVVKNIQSPDLNQNRKSRSYSPNYRLQNNVKELKDISIDTNPTVRLVRLLNPQHNSRSKRRSRSFSPAKSDTTDKSDSTEVSKRSSKRTKTIVKYQEPSLKSKVRRK